MESRSEMTPDMKDAYASIGIKPRETDEVLAEIKKLGQETAGAKTGEKKSEVDRALADVKSASAESAAAAAEEAEWKAKLAAAKENAEWDERIAQVKRGIEKASQRDDIAEGSGPKKISN